MNNILHELSIFGDRFQLACGACQLAVDADLEDYERLVQGARRSGNNSEVAYHCPCCGTKAEMTFDQLCAGEFGHVIH